ncbi:MAG: glycosyltransferase [Myxococcota bacterium]
MSGSATIRGTTGIVAIGRNEGQRLRACLESLPAGCPRVYVDSASSDGSAALARELSVEVVELDPARPLSAARARNAGFARLRELAGDLSRVQFLDGDCELEPGWLAAAEAALDADPALAAVCGRRRERHPDASPYNRLIDMEWEGAPGRTERFGGDVMLRAAVFEALGGYDESLIAGEDPELARRVRRAGHAIERLDAPMTRHDAALSRFSQWWTRQVRAGHAAAEAWWREGGPDLSRRLGSILFWGAALPVAVALGVWQAGAIAWTGLLLYAALAVRIAVRQRRAGRTPGDAALYAAACLEGKFAEALGAVRFALRTLSGSAAARPELIEYK